MTPKKYALGVAVRVKWIDSTTLRGWSHPPTDGPYEPATILSQGFVVESTQQCLTLTTSIDKKDEAVQVIAPLTIPWGCIEALTELPDEFHA